MYYNSALNIALINKDFLWSYLHELLSFGVSFFRVSLVGPGHVLIAAYDERTCSQLRDVRCTPCHISNAIYMKRVS